MTARIPFSELRAATSLPAVIGADVTLRREGRLWAACCPFHSERTPSLFVWPDHFHCFGCGQRGDVFDWLTKYRRMSLTEAIRFLGGDTLANRSIAAPASLPAPSARDNTARRVEQARRIWCEAVPAIGTPAEAYLYGRGVALPADAPIRFHPRCPCGPDGDRLPAMIGLMTDPLTGEPTGIHRTFLLVSGTRTD